MNRKKITWNSIQTKLVVFILAILSFAVIIQVTNVFMFGQVIDLSNKSIKQNVQQLTSLQKGVLALSQAEIVLEELMDTEASSSAALAAKETEFIDALSQFDMYFAALKWGSESEAFQKIGDGTLAAAWAKAELQNTTVLEPLDQNSAQLAGQASIYAGGYRTNATKLIETKKRYTTLVQQRKLTELPQTQNEITTYVAKTRTLAKQTRELLQQTVEHKNKIIIADANSTKTLQTTAETVTLVVNLLLLIASSLIAIIFIRRTVMKPLSSLIRVTESFSNAEFSARFTDKRQDEIGMLGEIFNNMADKLSSHTKDLQTDIDKKTSDLRVKMEQIESQNKNLDEAKRAMVNVMEDMQKDEAEINEQRKILDTVIHNIPMGVALTEPSGKAILVNEAGIALLGRGIDPNAKPEDVGKIYQFSKSDGSPYPTDELAYVAAQREGKAVTKDDVVVQHPDGAKITIRATSVPIKNAEGQIVSVISVFEDITKERDIDRMKTEFISLASHQLRTPLSAIKWFSEMLLGGDAGELTAEQKEFTKNISDSTQRMIDLVNGLLNVSRMESGRILVDPKPTDLKELVDTLVMELQVKIKERQQTLIVSVHQDLPKINVDAKLIRQVYMNLLTNAIKYTPKGGEISVFISKKDNDVISQVADNGYGIPKAEQAKMFQKFFRATNIIKIETDGTGLGLYLLKAIVASSQGKLWFESYTKDEAPADKKPGTTFWFSLPMSGMVAKKGEVTLDE
jgi:two-component system, OmpR family, phosphate regulon sensor histidine kinase PhoR